MSKLNKLFLFKNGESKCMLFRLINYSDESDELKFIFLTKGVTSKIIQMKNPDSIAKDDIITGFNEFTYHQDGSFLSKIPSFSNKSLKYFNPFGEGARRRALDEITDWEPIFHFEVLNYHVLEYPNSTSDEKGNIEYLEKENIFNGQPFGVVISLIHNDFHVPDVSHPDELKLRVKNVAENLDLWIIISKINKKSNRINVEGHKNPVFSRGNLLKVVKAKT